MPRLRPLTPRHMQGSPTSRHATKAGRTMVSDERTHRRHSYRCEVLVPHGRAADGSLCVCVRVRARGGAPGKGRCVCVFCYVLFCVLFLCSGRSDCWILGDGAGACLAALGAHLVDEQLRKGGLLLAERCRRLSGGTARVPRRQRRLPRLPERSGLPAPREQAKCPLMGHRHRLRSLQGLP